VAVRTLRDGVLEAGGIGRAADRIVPLGEEHLRRTASEFVRHYRFERNHQGLANELIESRPSPANTNGRVERRERLGVAQLLPPGGRLNTVGAVSAHDGIEPFAKAAAARG
jgi:hypothetical protein